MMAFRWVHALLCQPDPLFVADTLLVAEVLPPVEEVVPPVVEDPLAVTGLVVTGGVEELVPDPGLALEPRSVVTTVPVPVVPVPVDESRTGGGEESTWPVLER